MVSFTLQDPADASLEEVRLARRALKPPADVHEARKHLKRARGFLRLCEAGRLAGEATGMRRELRDAGRELAALRDRQSALEAVRDMDGETRAPPGLTRDLQRDAVDAGADEPESFPRLRRSLARSRKSIRRLQGETQPGEWCDRLGDTYRRARRAFRQALAHPSAEALHTLRKRTKDLRYQVEWLQPLWPEILGAWARELHLVTDDLGRVQDARVARQAIRRHVAPDERRRAALLVWDLRRDGRRARRAAMGRAGKLFAEKPSSFTRRLQAVARS
jgi:CHAD domain-containing protein